MDENLCPDKSDFVNTVSSKILYECSSEQMMPKGVNGPIVAKVPVVIAEPRVQVNIESVIKLEQPALEIKRIKKNVYLTQCKLINTDPGKSGKLFISGFVRKNIEYATVDSECPENGTISGDIRHTTARIPFQCVTKVDYINPPVECKKDYMAEIEILRDDMTGCDPCVQNSIGRDPCGGQLKHYEYLAEKVFCELEDVQIFEEDVHLDPYSIGCAFPNEQLFKSISEKTVLFLRIKVLQRQQVNIPGTCSHSKDKDYKYIKEDNKAFEDNSKDLNHGWKIVSVPRVYSNIFKKKKK